MDKKQKLIASMLVSVLGILSCSAPVFLSGADNNSNTVNSAEEQQNTDVETEEAVEQEATEPPAEPLPEDTPVPSDSPVPSSTSVCDLVSFVSDVTVPDDTQFDPGQGFTKTWRLKNNGSCTWTSGYELIFDSGDSMNGPTAKQLTSGTVPPGDTVDVSVNLTAPGSGGTYKGFWKLRNSQGSSFGLSGGNPFWVQIGVVEPSPTPTGLFPVFPGVTLIPIPITLKPDLEVVSLQFIPATPVQGQPVTVKITIRNNSIVDVTDTFSLLWFPTETSTVQASWGIGSLDAGESRTFTYNYSGYNSWYASISPYAFVDYSGKIDEFDETNNNFSKTISVSKP